MITPNDIINKKFDKSMGGYKVDSVNHYMETMATEVSQLIAEKQDLENKLGILAEKLEEYKNDEDSLRVALLSAQKLGDSVIREARSKSDIIMRDASIKAEKMIENAQKQIEFEHGTLLKLQKEVGNFKGKLMAVYKQHLELINALPSTSEIRSQEQDEQIKVQPKQEIFNTEEINNEQQKKEENNLKNEKVTKDKKVLGTETVKFAVVNDKEKVPQKELAKDDSKNESRFGPLRFGEGYDLKREG